MLALGMVCILQQGSILWKREQEQSIAIPQGKESIKRATCSADTRALAVQKQVRRDAFRTDGP